MINKVLNKINTYENKLFKYKSKIDDIFEQIGGDVNEDLKLLKQLELQINDTNQENNKVSLLNYQIDHANNLIKILNKNNVGLDSSDPGIGKTYIASYICRELGLEPIVICPKNVINSWSKVLKLFNVKYLTITNYELFTRGKHLFDGIKIVSPYVKFTQKKKLEYEWKVPENCIFIFDEVHKCKFLNTKNAKLLLGAKNTGNKILLLSATIVENPFEFAIFGYVLGLSQSLQILTQWLKKLSAPSKTIHTLLYDKINPKASRLTISELGDKFPETQITADTYTMKKSSDISKEYEKITEKIKKFKEEGEQSKFMIAKLQTEFRNIELLKIPTFVELCNDYLENNYSVVIFVNYTETLKLLSEKLNTKTLIYGDQTQKERDKVIDDFQSDKSRILIANIKAGGVGISLHDINGKHPRVSLISPTQSATNLIQALGRIYRSGGKTKSLQRIIFAANTPEENISKMLFKKLSNLSLLNDGDMESYYIDGLIEDKNFINQQKEINKSDMIISIDEQLDRIKKKNISKVKHLSSLFPNLINIISGVSNVFLLKSTKLFDNKEILLLGENHSVVEPCKFCGNNCIEILDLLTYVSYALSPLTLNFYFEHWYKPYDQQEKFGVILDFDKSASRLEKFYKYYKHLLDSKYPATENIKLHAVDVRSYDLTNKNKLIYTFANLTNISYIFFGYVAHDIFTDMLKPTDETSLIYDKNKTKFIELENKARHIYKFLNENIDSKEINDILSGNENIFDLLKLTKQKKKFIESNSKLNDSNSNNLINEFVTQVDEHVKNYFINHKDDIHNFLKLIHNKLQSIDHIDNNKEYVRKLVNKLIKHKHSYEQQIFKENEYFMNLMSLYMDYYTIFRMLRKFDDKEQNNVIFYGGFYHSSNIYKILKSTNFFEIIISKNESYGGLRDCQKL